MNVRNFPSVARTVLAPAIETFLGLLYPSECVQCGAPVAAGEYVCAGCAAEAQRIGAPYCRTCSQPFDGAIEGPFSCANCHEREFAFDCAVSRYRSRAVVRDLILRFKYHQQFYLRRPLSVHECASVLRQAGAASVRVLTVARG